MRRVLLCLAAAIACSGTEPSSSPRVLVDPILDSLFVGDTIAARTVTYLDAAGDTQATGPVRWSSSDTAVFGVDSVSGVVAARRGGNAVLSARANGITGTALIVVSRALELTLLLDTIYLMPGDTFTIPVAVQDADGVPPPVWFDAPTSGLLAVDLATGLITATAAGAPVSYTAHADSVTATGSIEVVQLTDTLGGKGYYTIFGTVIRRAKRTARAVNYRRQGDTATFRVTFPLTNVENVVITLRDSIAAPGPFAIDSISPAEAFGSGADFLCRPARSWAAWSLETAPPIRALSRRFGTIVITQIDTLANGLAVSGRFTFTGQRFDLYDDPLGALPIRGTFVAPLITDTRPCRS